MRWLEDRGHRATLSFDLCGTGSVVGNPRGDQPDAFANRFAAVAAGLGHLSRAGFVVSPELGALGRYVAVFALGRQHGAMARCGHGAVGAGGEGSG